MFFDRSCTNKDKNYFKKKKKNLQQFFERSCWTRINIPKHERSRDNTPENSSWSNYASSSSSPRSNRWISFQFSSTRYSSYAALEMETYYLPGEIRPFPDHVNYGNCGLLARANSPKSALCPPDSRVVLLVLNPLWTWPPATRIVARRVSTFLGLVSFCYCSIITNDSNNSRHNDLKLTRSSRVNKYRENCKFRKFLKVFKFLISLQNKFLIFE